MHISVPMEHTVELLEVTPVNPLVSKCQVKVCYVSDQPNRNRSVITKEVAKKMAATLPGCPIVGYYDERTGDFSGHNRSIETGDGKFRIVDKTKAYGFVDMGAKIWFQKFMDDGVNEREYLMTEGWLWTSIYEESKRILTHGNNQSMELSEENLDGAWSFDDKGSPKFFIINEAMIQKLCILGEDVEPCFEGAGVAAQFSFDGDFKNQLFSLMEDIKNALNKGGFTSMNDENKIVESTEGQIVDPDTEFKKKDEEEKKDNPFPPKADEGEDKKDEEKPAEGKADEEKPAESEDKKKADDEDDEDKKKKAATKHSLTDDEIAESDLYKNLAVQFAQLQKDFAALETEIASLRQFKTETDRKAKQEMIDGFYMLSDAEKKDCVDHIDEYSLDTIEAKLSVICVRNKVSFSLEDDKQEKKSPENPLVYELGGSDGEDNAPAWIKAVRETAKEFN